MFRIYSVFKTNEMTGQIAGFALYNAVNSISYLASDTLIQSSDYSKDFSPTYRGTQVSFPS